MFGPPMHESPRRQRERKPRVDREHAEAVALMQMVRMHESRWPTLVRLFAVPNGGARSKAAAGKLKAEGTRRGVPDYLWPVHSVPARIPSIASRIAAGSVGYPTYWVGLALELKAKGGRLEPAQREWLLHLEEQGWRCVVAYGADEAWAAIREYCEGLPAV